MVESAFFQDLAVLTAIVGVVSVIFSKIKFPKVIGYLLAGVLMSRHTWGGSFFVDEQSISTIGQLGVLFLMFTLGLEFSSREMKKVKHVSIPTAIFDAVMMIWLGYTFAHEFLKWDHIPSLFLGAAICDSATTLLAKTIEEMRWTSRPFVNYIFGTTIFEDILCVGVLAFVTGVATGKGMSFGSAVQSFGELTVFFTGVIVFGLAMVPRFLNKVAKFDDETLLLTLLGFCFLISYIAFKLNFSLALGAFLVGILGASSEARSRINRLVAPLRNFFAAIFFVSVGVLVNPSACWEYKGVILSLVMIVIFGKGFNCFFMSLLTGQKVKDSVQTGFGLAQIGEFAYMVALLYMTIMHDAGHPMYQIVVAVSLITTCLNPIMLKISDPVGSFVESKMPELVRTWLSAYADWLNKFRRARVPNRLQRHMRVRFMWIIVIWILNICVAVGSTMLSNLDYSNFSMFFNTHKKFVFCIITLLFCVGMMTSPLTMLARSLGRDFSLVIIRRRAVKKWQENVRMIVTWFVMLVIYMISLAQILMFMVNLLPDSPVTKLILITFFVVIAIIYMIYFKDSARKAGHGFREAMNAERRALRQQHKEQAILAVPDDFHTNITLQEKANAIGKTIQSLNIRARTGASIICVERSGEKHRNPGADWCFKKGDVVTAIGDPSQMESLKILLR